MQIVKAPATDEIASMRVRFYTYKLDEANPAASAFEEALLELVKQFVPEVDGSLNNYTGNGRPQVSAMRNVRLANLAAGATYVELADEAKRKFSYAASGTILPADMERIWSIGIAYKMFGNRYELRIRCAASGSDVVCE